ncbi:hypothetical protein PXD04_11480 (plasmid) [Methanosphaera sp. ISO3-F5]|uniref:hypothetical protein n=1 Tax=Methanosphaera sp. ISO3-F5 TaxID=1452353 RepID=UPI002B259D67|nr:hypothetical protein [Methanosphaera sp. ISO3-F5]WQH65363.1 hypothetical protein PXD04_11480 [Methanosphaera sp. ISO3-F5]
MKKKHINNFYKDIDLYKTLLTEHYPVEISLQPYDKVRIKYEHPYCDNYDYCIVFKRINNKIKLITTFNAPTITYWEEINYG